MAAHADAACGPRHSRWTPELQQALPILFYAATLTAAVLCTAIAFFVPKKDGRRRIILDCLINTLLRSPPPTPLPLFAGLFRILADSTHVAAFDMVSFFNQFGLSHPVSAFFTIFVNGRRYRYRRLPMGWKFAPCIAQRTLLVLLKLAGCSKRSIVWIDNVLLFGSHSQVRADMAALQRVFERFRASFRIETGPEPVTHANFIGCDLDMDQQVAALTSAWVKKFRTFCTEVSDEAMALRTLERLSGYCVWACTALNIPLVQCSALLRHVSHCAKNPDGQFKLPAVAKTELAWLLDNLRPAPFCVDRPPLSPQSLWTDSSTAGAAIVWTDDGGIDVGPTFQWWWNDASLAAHINAKELSCLLHALTKYKLRDVTLKWVTDNKVAFDIMRSQYCRSPRLLQILKPIVLWTTVQNTTSSSTRSGYLLFCNWQTLLVEMFPCLHLN